MLHCKRKQITECQEVHTEVSMEQLVKKKIMIQYIFNLSREVNITIKLYKSF